MRFIVRGALLLTTIVAASACERSTYSAVDPLPGFGFSETESVGKRGTEPGGFFARSGSGVPAAASAGGAAVTPPPVQRAVEGAGANVPTPPVQVPPTGPSQQQAPEHQH